MIFYPYIVSPPRLEETERKEMIDTLVKIYNKWGDRPENNNLQPLGSADEMLMNETATMSQCEWLERFIDVWNKTQERERKQHERI